MNAITTIAPTSAGLMPTNLREAMDLATMMSKSKLVPQALQSSPADCLLVIEQSMRWGMSPFAVAQEVSVIQGKMMFSGKIVAAAVHTSGVLDGRLSYAYEGDGQDLAVTAIGTLRGEQESRDVHVRLTDARTSNQHWAKSPKQMLSYHAARVWARRHAPEVMLGVYTPEEFDEPAQEPRRVQATVVRPGLGQNLTREQMDETLNGDDIPVLEAPKPDRMRKVANRFRERMAEVQDQDAYNAIMGNMGLIAEWEKIRKERPELDEEMQGYASEALERITRELALEAAE